MKLKSLTLVLENCEQITIDGKYIGSFLVDNLNTCISRIAINSIRRIDTANTIVIEIHKDADMNSTNVFWDDKRPVFNRIMKYDDITNIDFVLENQYVEDGETPSVEEYSYCVNWVGESDMENEAQTSYISNEGHLYIVIDKDAKIEDFFDLEEINNADYMDFHWDMLMD